MRQSSQRNERDIISMVNPNTNHNHNQMNNNGKSNRKDQTPKFNMA